MKDKLKIDGHKLNYHPDRVKDWMEKQNIAPMHIDLGITTGCNISCSFCYPDMQGRTTTQKNRYNMPESALLKLLTDAKLLDVKSISFIGEGENTLNPALYNALDYAKDINLDVSLATNGVVLKKNKLETMLDSLSWLRVNISAASPESYFNIHGKPYFKLVTDNIKNMVDAKQKGNYKAIIGMQTVLITDNLNEIVALSKLGKELGVDNITFKPCSDTWDRKLQSPVKEYIKLEDIFKEAESYSNDNYQVVIKRNKIQNEGMKDYKQCFGTQFIISVNGMGDVYPCCHWQGDERKEEFYMGNIVKDSLLNIVASHKYKHIQRKIRDEIDVNNDCESNCRQHYINQYLWDIKTGKIDITKLNKPKDNPPCVNFI